MIRIGYRYTFTHDVHPIEIEDLLHLAILSATAIHGEAATLLDVRYLLNRDQLICTIDASTPIGREVNKLFTSYVTEEIGAEHLRIEHLSEQEVVG